MASRLLISKPKSRPANALCGALAGLLLAGCSNAAEEAVAAPDWAMTSRPALSSAPELAAEDGTAQATGSEQAPEQAIAPDQVMVAAQDCLLAVWDVQDRPDRAFDGVHDQAEGGAISCATKTSASQFEATLSSLRTAAAGNDRPALLRELNVPLMFIDVEGNRHVIDESELAESRFDEVFTPEVLSALADLQLEDMVVVPGQGGYFELGSIWLVAREQGGRPRLITVNRQALQEAAAAERNAELAG